MSTRRLLMGGKHVDLKNIKATLTVGSVSETQHGYGFSASGGGSISPNPLPNGVSITQLAVGYYLTSHSQTRYTRLLSPDSLKFTLNGVQYAYSTMANQTLFSYLRAN